jgi:protein-tyrosine phosphatase
MSVTVLVVCTGNICRSAAGERLLRARLTQSAPTADVQVSSAGTHGLTGRPIDEPTAVALRELGIDAGGHQARRLDTLMLGAADLILTATVGQRAIILDAEPQLLARTFTLREFARLAGSVPSSPASVTSEQQLRSRVALVAGRRGYGDASGPPDNDIGDPFGGSLKAARTAAAEVAAAVDAILAGLELAGANGVDANNVDANGVDTNGPVTVARHRA